MSIKGLDFLKVIPVEDLQLNPKIISKGSPSGNRYLKDLLKNIEININDSILDIGSAKGSALRMMLKFPFKNIDGLEISRELVEISNRNFQKLKSKTKALLTIRFVFITTDKRKGHLI